MPLSRSGVRRGAFVTRTRREITKAAAATVVILAAASCTLLGSRDVVQCNVAADCPPGRPVCAAGLCTAHAGADDGASGNDAGSDGPVVRECVVTEDCSQAEGKFLCVAGTCRRADTPTCPLVLPADTTYRQEPVIVVGVYTAAPITGSGRAAVQFALDEVNNGLQPPHIAAVVCAKGTELTKFTARDSIAHLATLRVPLVIGDFETSEIAAVASAAATNGMALWSTLGNDVTVQPPGFGGVRFLLDELKNVRSAYQRVLDKAVARANVLNGSTPANVKVTLIASTKTPEANALANAIKSSLVVDGKALSLVVRPVESVFERTPSSSNGALVAALASENPDVVIAIGGDEIAREIVDGVEAIAGSVKPVWVLASRSKYNINDLTRQVTLGRTAFRARVIGVDFAGSAPAQASYAAAAKAATGNPTVASSDLLYDATYVVALTSVLAARSRDGGAGTLSSEDFMRGLALLAPEDAGAETVGVGTPELTKGISFVNQGTRVHFSGVTGPWTFEGAKNSRRMGVSMFCFKPGSSELAYYLDPDLPLAGNCFAP